MARFINKDAAPVRVRFITNVAHGGTDYGPDFAEDEALLPAKAAFHYVAQGRAVEVDELPSAPPLTTQSVTPPAAPALEGRETAASPAAPSTSIRGK